MEVRRTPAFIQSLVRLWWYRLQLRSTVWMIRLVEAHASVGFPNSLQWHSILGKPFRLMECCLSPIHRIRRTKCCQNVQMPNLPLSILFPKVHRVSPPTPVRFGNLLSRNWECLMTRRNLNSLGSFAILSYLENRRSQSMFD